MRDWAALDWRAFGLAWIAVVFGGDHLERQNVSMWMLSRSKTNSVSTSRSKEKSNLVAHSMSVQNIVIIDK